MKSDWESYSKLSGVLSDESTLGVRELVSLQAAHLTAKAVNKTTIEQTGNK